jgi:hypothetical protein
VRGARLCDGCERFPHGHPIRARRLRPCARCGSDEPKPTGVKFCSTCAPVEAKAAAARKAARRRLKQKGCRTGCGRRVMRLPNGRTSHYCAPCRRERVGQVRKCERCPRPARAKHAKLCVECKRVADARMREVRNRWNRERAKPRARRSGPTRTLREAKRMTYRLAVERAEDRLVQPVAVVKGATYMDGTRKDSVLFPALPSAPLAVAVNRLIRRERSVNPLAAAIRDEAPDSTRNTVCERLGIHTRRLYAWEHGEAPNIQFDTADAILAKADWLWWDVWEPCEPCPEDLEHRKAITADGHCPRCDAYSAFRTAERAFEAADDLSDVA